MSVLDDDALDAFNAVVRRNARVRPHETVIDVADLPTALSAALPLIERAVREQVARDIAHAAYDPIRGIPFDHNEDVATVVAWIEEWFDDRARGQS